MDANLHRRTHGIIAMHEGIEDGLAQGGIRHWVTLDTLDALVGDGSLEVFRLHEVNGAGSLGKEVAMNGIVVGEIGFRTEEADFDEGSGDELLGVFMEEENGGALEIGALGELELFDEGGLGGAQVRRIEAATGAGQITKLTNGGGGEVRDFDAGHGHAIPGAALPAEKETVQRGTFQLLQGATAALKIVPTVANGIGIGIHDDLQPRQAIFFMRIHGDKDTEEIANFVRDILQQLLRIRQADDPACVIAPDVKDAAFGIGEATDPAEELIPPSLLPFETLVFFHALSSLMTSQVTSSRSVFS